jgi:hypothetical protein
MTSLSIVMRQLAAWLLAVPGAIAAIAGAGISAWLIGWGSDVPYPYRGEALAMAMAIMGVGAALVFAGKRLDPRRRPRIHQVTRGFEVIRPGRDHHDE